MCIEPNNVGDDQRARTSHRELTILRDLVLQRAVSRDRRRRRSDCKVLCAGWPDSTGGGIQMLVFGQALDHVFELRQRLHASNRRGSDSPEGPCEDASGMLASDSKVHGRVEWQASKVAHDGRREQRRAHGLRRNSASFLDACRMGTMRPLGRRVRQFVQELEAVAADKHGDRSWSLAFWCAFTKRAGCAQDTLTRSPEANTYSTRAAFLVLNLTEAPRRAFSGSWRNFKATMRIAELDEWSVRARLCGVTSSTSFRSIT